MRTPRLVVLLLPLLACLAPAARADAVHLRWNACSADGGVMNRSFACDTNTGSERLIGSFHLDSPLRGVTGASAIVDLATASGLLPEWWMMFNPGSCRATALSANATLPATAVNCVDWSGGQALGLVGGYELNPPIIFPTPTNVVRIRVAVTAPAGVSGDVIAGEENFVFTLVVQHQKSTGSGACAGCGVPACIGLKRLNLSVADPPASYSVLTPTALVMEGLATWQGGAGVTRVGYYPGLTDCPAATPARPSSWGAVKAMYR